ncbi:MAG: adenylate/guanylate cyclase domain-containing protein [Betaproteobacteria bacterium]
MIRHHRITHRESRPSPADDPLPPRHRNVSCLRRDYGAIGRVTNLAARLCGEAKGGQILLSAEVAQASQAGIAVEPVAPLTLKGFASPIQTYQVVQGG